MSQELPFEKAMEKLEKLVEDLESGDLSLEDALKKYEEGVRLSHVCQERLTQAEKKIEILTRGLDGSLVKKKFEDDENAYGAESSSSGPRDRRGPSAPVDEEGEEP
ncbi:MAG: exodeoxyribonuclease VII small subunit [Candidatus Omnitrophica bacterium]|nr:exodeoxyribonuclease VII small subunit [Candidatus Omnitrophota bacterium]